MGFCTINPSSSAHGLESETDPSVFTVQAYCNAKTEQEIWQQLFKKTPTHNAGVLSLNKKKTLVLNLSDPFKTRFF